MRACEGLCVAVSWEAALESSKAVKCAETAACSSRCLCHAGWVPVCGHLLGLQVFVERMYQLSRRARVAGRNLGRD